LYWEDYDRVSINPKTNEEISVRRRRIRIDTDLPMKETYSQFVRSFLDPQAVARR
jgi:hypothetical protein